MVTTFALTRAVAATLRRASAVTGRDLVAARHAAYWLVLISGFFEPMLYLLAIGFGVGGLVEGFRLPDGSTVSYAKFVAPAMLAASAMNGAIAETAMNFFGKMKYVKLYDAVIATPVSPFEIALGELMWALLRGVGYSVAFLAIMAAMGLTTPFGAIMALPLTVLVGVSFGGIGMILATFMRGWQDFDYVNVVLFGMFLFSGTFAPIDGYAPAARVFVYVTPLYHAVALLRGVTLGTTGWDTLVNAGYLVVIAAVTLMIAARRTERVLRG